MRVAAVALGAATVLCVMGTVLATEPARPNVPAMFEADVRWQMAHPRNRTLTGHIKSDITINRATFTTFGNSTRFLITTLFRFDLVSNKLAYRAGGGACRPGSVARLTWADSSRSALR